MMDTLRVGAPGRDDILVQAGRGRTAPWWWRGVRSDRYTYVVTGGFRELYDRVEDPWQLQKAFAPLDEKERASLSAAAQKIHGQLFRNKANEGASSRLRQFIAGRKGEIWQIWNADETRRRHIVRRR